MSFFIKFTNETFEGMNLGQITLGENVETFESSNEVYDFEKYRAQWRSAIDLTLSKRITTCLISSLEIDCEGRGVIWAYGLIPGEDAGGSPDHEKSNETIYVTEFFKSVTRVPGDFEYSYQVTLDQNCLAATMPLHYFDHEHPEMFYRYIDNNISNISSWRFLNEDFQGFLRQH